MYLPNPLPTAHRPTPNPQPPTPNPQPPTPKPQPPTPNPQPPTPPPKQKSACRRRSSAPSSARRPPAACPATRSRPQTCPAPGRWRQFFWEPALVPKKVGTRFLSNGFNGSGPLCHGSAPLFHGSGPLFTVPGPNFTVSGPSSVVPGTSGQLLTEVTGSTGRGIEHQQAFWLSDGHGSKAKASTPSEHPNPTTKIGSKNGWCTYPKMGYHWF